MLVTKQILTIPSMPIADVTATVTDANGTAIVRNGVTISRLSSANGIINIPVVDGDFITYTKDGFAAITQKVGSSDTIYLYNQHIPKNLKNMFLHGGLMVQIGFVLIGLTLIALAYDIYKKFKK